VEVVAEDLVEAERVEAEPVAVAVAVQGGEEDDLVEEVVAFSVVVEEGVLALVVAEEVPEVAVAAASREVLDQEAGVAVREEDVAVEDVGDVEAEAAVEEVADMEDVSGMIPFHICNSIAVCFNFYEYDRTVLSLRE